MGARARNRDASFDRPAAARGADIQSTHTTPSTGTNVTMSAAGRKDRPDSKSRGAPTIIVVAFVQALGGVQKIAYRSLLGPSFDVSTLV